MISASRRDRPCGRFMLGILLVLKSDLRPRLPAECDATHGTEADTISARVPNGTIGAGGCRAGGRSIPAAGLLPPGGLRRYPTCEPVIRFFGTGWSWFSAWNSCWASA